MNIYHICMQIITRSGLVIVPISIHFGSCICVGVANVQSLGWKGKQTPNWAPMTPLERS